jgi:thioredoxin reductase
MVVPYKRFTDRTRFDAIVIGSGIGGLGAAALLARAASVAALSGAVTTVSAMLGRNLFGVPGHGI